jgi:NAD(P)H dehydrogenase (quinone)
VRVYVVFCHPTHDSLMGAALQRVLRGLDRAGHEVRLTDLYAEGFRPELDEHDRRLHHVDHRRHPELRADLADHIAHLQWCQSIVLVYPTWWAGQPAMLKGWFDRVWTEGVAWELPPGADHVRPLLRNVGRILAVTSHGSSKLVNAAQGESGKRTVTRALRQSFGMRVRTHWIAIYGVDRCAPSELERFLDRVESRLAAL